jgi:Transient receptor potential (TRP) ion channel/ML-like domain
MNSSVPITGGAVIPVSASDVSNIPPIALSIPDFEGSAYLRIFSNSSQTQIACFSAVMRNGASFSHPTAVGSVLGIFTVVALLASFATAIYGISVPHIRTHYAHSLSVLVVVEVFQSIFFSGALSLNWPSVCAAFWSNFAWSAGMIYTPSIMNSLNSFTGVSGNSSQVGGAGSTIINNNGGLQQQIYGRSLEERTSLAMKSELVASGIYKRAVNKTASSLEYAWAGVPVQPGLPIPGNWSGFAGELSLVDVPAPDAFLTGLLWFMILLAILIGATTAFKWTLEGLSSMKRIKHDRLALFRSHWLEFLGLIVLRSCFIAFFMMMTLTLYQFSYGGKVGPLVVAVIVFVIFFLGAIAVATYACFYRAKFGKYESSPDRLHFQRGKALKFLPWYRTVRESSMEEGDKAKSVGSVSFFQLRFVDHDAEIQSVHENTHFTKRFGWLSARFRRTRWWFFAFWVVYQFVRACFIGGARASPTAQVFGIFIWELIAFIAIILINPFEGARNTALAVYMLGISKVATSGLSIAFLPQFNLARIPTTVVGVIIIVIQGFLVIGLLILIVLGAISSYMSITRNRDEFKPHRLENIRMKYFGHLEQKEKDVPPPPPPMPEEPKEPYFQLKAVRRAPKIEDEDVDYVPEMNDFNPNASQYSVAAPVVNRMSRTNSLANSMRSHASGYGNVPYGARVHRASWSSRDFQNWQDDESIRADSPFGIPSRSASAADHHPHNSISMAPLVRPSPSHGSMRPATPTREQQRQYSSQRINRAN